ncbi:MAG: glycine cleavage system protein GcvH [Planctomycetota bacterium]|jgi:glycine cleavage system H protein
MADVPGDRRYLSSHEWAIEQDGTITIGITAHAAEELGELVFIDLPKVGSEVSAGESFGEIESVKAVSSLNSPISGKIVEVNDELESSLETIGESPYEGGWMLKVQPSDPGEYEGLLDADAYASQLDG